MKHPPLQLTQKPFILGARLAKKLSDE